MKIRLLSLILALALFAAVGAAAQNTLSLGRTTLKPEVDGVIGAKEYALTADAPDMRLALTWTVDTLYVGVRGQTRGWVAVGLGSGGMDGATIYIGSVRGGEKQVKVQRGAGHSHGDTSMDAPERYAMKETDGETTLELALKASEFIASDQTQLDLILAMGSSDSIREYHKARYGTSVTLAR
jgi:hypothetical protein